MAYTVDTGTLIEFVHKGDTLGIVVNAGLDDDGQPFVTVNTEQLAPEYRYNEATGLLATAEPYTYEQDGASAVVKGPKGDVVARHFPQPDSTAARLAAGRHCSVLNNEWGYECGAPIISVHLNDASLFDARDHNPDLRQPTSDDRTEAGKQITRMTHPPELAS